MYSSLYHILSNDNKESAVIEVKKFLEENLLTQKEELKDIFSKIAEYDTKPSLESANAIYEV
jgi:hypothetical protein